MSKAVKPVFLLVLTLVIYAVNGFLKDGSFIFPYPINDFFVLGLVIVYSLMNYRQVAAISFLGAHALLAVLANPFLWEILLSTEEFEKFLNTPWISIAYLLSIITLLAWGVYFSYTQKRILPSILSFIGTATLAYGIFTGNLYLTPLGYLFLTMSSFLKPIHHPFQWMWLALLLLESTKVFTILFA